MFAKITHEELIERAARWLRGTMRARVVLCEKWARNSEMPDAIGWTRCGSHLVECKCSLADFHADKRKTPRLCAGLGNFRWYMTPPGLLASVKLPACWGWLEVYPKQVRRRVRAREVPHGWWHHQAEMDMLAKWAMPETIQQQLERLRRLVGLLPRTAENLPVVFHGGGFHVAQPTPAFAAKVPGAFVTTLWHPDFNKPAEGWGYDHELGGYYLSWSFCRPNREVAAVERRPVHECYISREAAKAAADRHTGGEDA